MDAAIHYTDPLHLTVKYQPAHFYAIYYPEGRPTVFGERSHRSLIIVLIVCLIFLLIGVLNLIVSRRAPHEFSILLLVASMLIGCGCGIMLYKSIQQFRQRQSQIHEYVDALCSGGPVKLIVDNKGITQQTLQHTTTVPWAHVNDADVTETFIYITDGSHDWMYPKESMSPGDFEKLAEAVNNNYLID